MFIRNLRDKTIWPPCILYSGTFGIPPHPRERTVPNGFRRVFARGTNIITMPGESLERKRHAVPGIFYARLGGACPRRRTQPRGPAANARRYEVISERRRRL